MSDPVQRRILTPRKFRAASFQTSKWGAMHESHVVDQRRRGRSGLAPNHQRDVAQAPRSHPALRDAAVRSRPSRLLKNSPN